MCETKINFFFDSWQVEGLLLSASKKFQKVLVSVVFFLIYYALLSLVFKLEQGLEAQTYPEKISEYPKQYENTPI